MRRTSNLFVLLPLMLAPTAVHAATFPVTARIFCPANLVPGTTLVDSTFMAAPPVNVPCAGILVTAMDADPGFDDECGSAFTDAGGRVSFTGECGGDGAPEIYLKAEAESLSRFSVGVIPPEPLEHVLEELGLLAVGVPPGVTHLVHLEDLLEHETFEWVSEVRSDGTFGDRLVGGGGAISMFAARQFRVAQDSMFRLEAATRFRPMPFNYTVFAPFGFPTTLYDTVLAGIPGVTGPPVPGALNATPHEIGHVLYNTFHSDSGHWLVDMRDVIGRRHVQCGTFRLQFQTLAWYEGFANFIQDFVFQNWDWNTFNWTAGPGFRPFPGCAFTAGLTTMVFEGNVEGLLNNVFFGPVNAVAGEVIPPLANGQFSCPTGLPPVVVANQPPQCALTLPITCGDGILSTDGRGDTDVCVATVLVYPPVTCDPDISSCNPEPVGERVTRNPAGCPAGTPVRGPGPDTCTVLVPATHTLPDSFLRARPDGSPSAQLALRPDGTAAWFGLPTLDDVIEWVDRAGTDAHRASEFWRLQIRPWCLGRDGLRNRYCDPTTSGSFLLRLTALDPALPAVM